MSAPQDGSELGVTCAGPVASLSHWLVGQTQGQACNGHAEWLWSFLCALLPHGLRPALGSGFLSSVSFNEVCKEQGLGKEAWPSLVHRAGGTREQRRGAFVGRQMSPATHPRTRCLGSHAPLGVWSQGYPRLAGRPAEPSVLCREGENTPSARTLLGVCRTAAGDVG